jgi:hypothetical protein
VTDSRDFDEPDFAKHVANVLTDYRDGALDGLDEAVEAIVEHPAVRDAGKLAAMLEAMRRYLPPDSGITVEQFASEIIGMLDAKAADS